MSFQKRIETALATNDFQLLSPYHDPASWLTITEEERELLALLLVKQGEQQLTNGENKAIETFALASRAAPFSASVYFQQALALSYQQTITSLLASSAALDKATQLDPNFIAAWYGWGCVLVDIGTMNSDTTSFYQAHDKFSKADQLAQSNESQRPEGFFWQWGICWHRLGKISGEAVDYFKALEKFQIGATKESNLNSLFCIDYGNVLVEIAFLLDRKELLFDAVAQYKKSIEFSPAEMEPWVNLACTYLNLYEIYEQEEYFFEANEYFEHATTIDENHSLTWLKWAELCAYAGKKTKDLNYLQASFIKYEKAHQCEPDNAYVLARWGEVQMLASSHTDNLEYLRDAETKISKALELEPENAAFWYISAMCCSDLGSYFNDTAYFKQAIERFHRSLAIDEAHSSVHHGLAQVYYTLGEMSENIDYIENSFYHFNRALELTEGSASQCWNDWGVALMKLGEITNEKKYIESAVEKFEKAIGNKFNEAHPDKDIELEWLYNFGCAMDFLGDFHDDALYYERAIQILTHVVNVDPEYTHARYNLALSLSHLGELNSDVDCFLKATEHFQILLNHDIEDEYAWNDWGLTLTHLAVLTYDDTHPEFSRDYFEQAERKFLHSISLGNIHALYNIACLYALTKNMPAAMHYLERADLSNGLPPTEDVMHDEWLDNMRHHAPFRAFIAHLLNKSHKDEMGQD